MQYFVFSGIGEPQGPYPLAEIISSFKTGVYNSLAKVCPEGGSDWKPISSVMPKAHPVPAHQAHTATAKAFSLPPDECLRDVRRKTCYRGLRWAISLLTIAAIVGAVLGAIGGALFGLTHDAISCTIGAILGGIGSIFFIIVARDALGILIDIADTLIARHAAESSK